MEPKRRVSRIRIQRITGFSEMSARDERIKFFPQGSHMRSEFLPEIFPSMGSGISKAAFGRQGFSLLRSENPVCETAGWVALL